MILYKKLILILIFSLVIYATNYYLDRSVPYAEYEINKWFDNIRNQGATGRNCFHLNYGELNKILLSQGIAEIETGKFNQMVKFPISCIKEMKLVELQFHEEHNVVSGIYRCEKEKYIQELQLAIYLEPTYLKYKDECKTAKLQKYWNLPVGIATMYSIP